MCASDLNGNVQQRTAIPVKLCVYARPAQRDEMFVPYRKSSRKNTIRSPKRCNKYRCTLLTTNTVNPE